MSETFDAATLDRLVKTCRSIRPQIPPWTDDAGKGWYLIGCAPGSPAAAWADRHPEAAARMPIVETQLGPMRMLDPEIVRRDLAEEGGV